MPNTHTVALFTTVLACSASLAAERDYLAWVPLDYKDTIKCSDVIFMKPGTIEQYKASRADREAWGYRGAFPRKQLGKTTSLDPGHIKAAQALGMKYVGSTVAAIHMHWGARPELKAIAGESFDGDPLPRRLAEYRKPSDKRSLMGCVNIPAFRKRLFDYATYSVTSLGTDGLHLDDWHLILDAVDIGGCFCEHCMKGFGVYLEQRGVHDLGSSSYREFLEGRVRVSGLDDFLQRRKSLPLIREFRDFQFVSVYGFYRDLAAHVRQLGGDRDAVLTTNNGLRTSMSIGIAPLLDYLACEVHYGSRYRRLDERSVFVFKLADGLGMHIAANPWMQDWGFLILHPRPQMVRAWIALTYALGHNMMVPHFQTALIQKEDKSFVPGWYQAKDEEFLGVYRFVKDHPDLFDGYRSLAQVAIVHGAGAAEPLRVDVLSRGLAKRNYQFVAFTSGTDVIPLRLNAEQLAGLDGVILTCPFERLHRDDQAALNQVRGTVKLVRKIEDLPPSVVQAPDNVLVTLRGKPEDRGTLICHVLNRDYDFSTDRLRPASADIRLHRSLFAGRSIRNVTHFSMGRRAEDLDARREGDCVVIALTDLGTWAVVRVELGRD